MIRECREEFSGDVVDGDRMERINRERIGSYLKLSHMEKNNLMNSIGKKQPHASYFDQEEHDILTNELVYLIWEMYGKDDANIYIHVVLLIQITHFS